MAERLTATSTSRRAAAALLVGGVTLVHLWIGNDVAEQMRLDHHAKPRPPSIEVRFVRELLPQEPAAPPPSPRRSRRPAAPMTQSAAASAPLPAAVASAPQDLPPEAAPVDEGVAAGPAPPAGGDVTAGPEVQPADEAALAASAGTPPAADMAFEWPPSTRLHYRLSGWYRGSVEGSAQVQWLRDGTHYQVQLEVIVGPRVAPLLTRRMVSDGELTADGLRPRRYDEETKVALRPPRVLTTYFGSDRVWLPHGREVAAMHGMQDSASQFVQLTWLFTLQPQRLQAGEVVEFPLALPRRLDRWRYEVVGPDVLQTPLGGLPAVHLRPTRDTPVQPGQELVAEAWFAPTLQYLPVRLHIRQDAETYVDLVLSALPLQGP